MSHTGLGTPYTRNPKEWIRFEGRKVNRHRKLLEKIGRLLHNLEMRIRELNRFQRQYVHISMGMTSGLLVADLFAVTELYNQTRLRHREVKSSLNAALSSYRYARDNAEKIMAQGTMTQPSCEDLIIVTK